MKLFGDLKIGDKFKMSASKNIFIKMEDIVVIEEKDMDKLYKSYKCNCVSLKGSLGYMSPMSEVEEVNIDI